MVTFGFGQAKAVADGLKNVAQHHIRSEAGAEHGDPNSFTEGS